MQPGGYIGISTHPLPPRPSSQSVWPGIQSRRVAVVSRWRSYNGHEFSTKLGDNVRVCMRNKLVHCKVHPESKQNEPGVSRVDLVSGRAKCSLVWHSPVSRCSEPEVAKPEQLQSTRANNSNQAKECKQASTQIDGQCHH